MLSVTRKYYFIYLQIPAFLPIHLQLDNRNHASAFRRLKFKFDPGLRPDGNICKLGSLGDA